MTEPLAPPQYLFRHWDDVSACIRSSPRVAVLFDFDGTLVRIAATPNRVRLPASTRSALQKLAGRKRATLGVISGRRRKDLQDRIGMRRIKYLGLYGWERSENARHSLAKAQISRVYPQLLRELANFSGVWLEPKEMAVSIHLLGTTATVQRQVRQTVKRLLAPRHGSLHVIENLRDLEIVPRAIQDKGAAIRHFLRAPSLRCALPIYFGDDLSDEPAFLAVRGGISVLVGKLRTTRAEFYLREPSEVTMAISKIERVLQ